MKNRGIFFTLLTLTIIALFFLSYAFYSVIEDRRPIKERVETMNSFVSGVEEDLPRELYISGFRAIVISQKKIAETGIYLDDSESAIRELVFNGTLYGTQESLMVGTTIPELISSLQEKAEKINANLTMQVTSLGVYQENPWEITLKVNGTLSLVDYGNIAAWNREINLETKVPVEGFEDPVYTVNTQSLIVNKIRKTNITTFVSGTSVSNLQTHAYGSYYFATPLAPSYLQRLEGNMSSNENGIESLVYLPKLSSQGITVQQKTVVDYIYFSQQTPLSYRIQGMPAWFYIDDAHLNTYQVSSITQ